MGVFMEDEESWKCRKHPSKHRTTGVCAVCLRERLMSLCPDCANVRPCACCPTTTTTTTTSSSSASSSFSLSSSSDLQKSGCSGIGAVGRVSNLMDSEPAFRRSRSAVFQFLRPRISDGKDAGSRIPPPASRSGRSSVWSVFKVNKAKKVEDGREKEYAVEVRKTSLMMRSKSAGVSGCSDRGSDVRLKGRSWYFPSPMKVFRQPKTSNVLQERSPLCRG